MSNINFDKLDKYFDGFGTYKEKKLLDVLKNENVIAHKKVSQIKEDLKGDTIQTMAFCLELLESINFNKNSFKKIEDIFNNENKKINKV